MKTLIDLVNTRCRTWIISTLIVILSPSPVSIADALPAAIPTTESTPTASMHKIYESHTVNHRQAYKPHPERGDYIDIKVTPPTKGNGKKTRTDKNSNDGQVLVEVYNRVKVPVAHIEFDITLTNNGGFDITSPVKAEDLHPNLSGSQWIKIPMNKGAWPTISLATVKNLHVIGIDAKEIPINANVDLISH